MGDANPIRTLRDYSKLSHEGYRNTIELPVENIVVPLRSETIRDFAKPDKAISLPQDVPSTSDRRLIELENQVQHLMEAHISPMKPTQVNNITSSYEAKEEGSVKSSVIEYMNHEMTVEDEEEVESENEFEERTEDKIKEEEKDSLEDFDTFPTMKELRYHEWLQKNPRP
nr:MAK10-like protein [Tanacetum cinerariifolium]